MRTLTRTLRAAALALPLAFALACGDDTVVDPVFGSGCTAGTLASGDTILGRFTPSSCWMEMDWWSWEAAPYIAYDVKVTQGHAYMIRLDSLPDPDYEDFDAVLALYTQNDDGSTIPLAASDDEAGAHNSVLWFVAPVSGTFKLRASSYWYGGTGNYRLIMHECPVLATLDTAGTYNLTLGASPCVVPNAGGSAADTSRYSFVRLNAVAGEGVNLTLTTVAFPPVWELFAPGFDYSENIYSESVSGTAKGTGTSINRTLGDVGGQVTIAVGATTVDSAGGAFTLALTRTPPAAPPALARSWSIAGLSTMALKERPAKQH